VLPKAEVKPPEEVVGIPEGGPPVELFDGGEKSGEEVVDISVESSSEEVVDAGEDGLDPFAAPAPELRAAPAVDTEAALAAARRRAEQAARDRAIAELEKSLPAARSAIEGKVMPDTKIEYVKQMFSFGEQTLRIAYPYGGLFLLREVLDEAAGGNWLDGLEKLEIFPSYEDVLNELRSGLDEALDGRGNVVDFLCEHPLCLCFILFLADPDAKVEMEHLTKIRIVAQTIYTEVVSCWSCRYDSIISACGSLGFFVGTRRGSICVLRDSSIYAYGTTHCYPDIYAAKMFQLQVVNQMWFSFWGIGVELPPSAKIFTAPVTDALLANTDPNRYWEGAENEKLELPKDAESLVSFLFSRFFSAVKHVSCDTSGNAFIDMKCVNGETYGLSIRKFDEAMAHLQKICLDGSDNWIGGNRPGIAASFFFGVKKVFKKSRDAFPDDGNKNRAALTNYIVKLEALRKAAYKEHNTEKLSRATA
jgi:hypothetical protein